MCLASVITNSLQDLKQFKLDQYLKGKMQVLDQFILFTIWTNGYSQPMEVPFTNSLHEQNTELGA